MTSCTTAVGSDLDIGWHVQQFHVAIDDPCRPLPGRGAHPQADLALPAYADGSEQLLQHWMADRTTAELHDVVRVPSAKTQPIGTRRKAQGRAIRPWRHRRANGRPRGR